MNPTASMKVCWLPVFSADGKRVAWSARQSDGKYTIKVADFLDSPEPHLANIRDYQPGGRAYYEVGSFSIDGGLAALHERPGHPQLLVQPDLPTESGDGKKRAPDSGKAIQRASRGSSRAERRMDHLHQYASGVVRRPLHVMLGTEWYAMRLDGSGNKRLDTDELGRAAYQPGVFARSYWSQ